MQTRFNIRVYGIWFNSRGEVLVSEEVYQRHRLLKFPGGGLQYGEGLADCLRREWEEETGLTPHIIRHYYTTDFFQPSAFAPEEQIISVYYLVQCDEDLASIDSLEGRHHFHWLTLEDLAQDHMLSLPIDRHVAQQLHADFAQTLSAVA